ncbi:MAG TPA: hypothetical protein VGD71_04105 [Kribbella sp.]|jgi:short-chain fatty acids transporter
MADNHAKHARQEVEGEGPLARTALGFTAFTEKWLPDAFGFVLVGPLWCCCSDSSPASRC